MKAAAELAIVVLLLVTSFTSGCLGKQQEVSEPTAPSVTEAPIEDLEAQFPDPTAPSEDEIVVTEPDLEVNESVDLGSIL